MIMIIGIIIIIIIIITIAGVQQLLPTKVYYNRKTKSQDAAYAGIP